VKLSSPYLVGVFAKTETGDQRITALMQVQQAMFAPNCRT